jgi:excisionase family DNA binding protein
MLKVFLLLLGVAATAFLGALDVHTTVIDAATIPAAVMAVAANVDPIFVSVAAAAEILATSRSEIYQKLARGELDAVKDGTRTKNTYDSVKRAAAAMPKASMKLYVPRRAATAHANKPSQS